MNLFFLRLGTRVRIAYVLQLQVINWDHYQKETNRTA
jgi:hypothetical protein